MERWTFIRISDLGQVMILPSAGKLAGHYPADYENRQEEGKDEQQMAGK